MKSRCFTAIIRNCTSLQKTAGGRCISGVTRMTPLPSRLRLRLQVRLQTGVDPLDLMQRRSGPTKRGP